MAPFAVCAFFRKRIVPEPGCIIKRVSSNFRFVREGLAIENTQEQIEQNRAQDAD